MFATLACGRGSEPEGSLDPSALAGEPTPRLVARARALGAIAAPSTSSARDRLRVALPATAAGLAAIEDARSGLRTGVSLAGARDGGRESVDGVTVHRDALGPGADLLRVVAPGAMEDLVAFAARPVTERVRFRFDVVSVAGLRLVSGSLELLDATGAPRLRVPEPFVVDATGARRPARLALRGCAYDADPRAPWGRPVVAPGASACELEVDWSGADVRYPAIVDPLWTATGSMAGARHGHTATLLANGKVLVAGGDDGGSVATSELYDPASGTFAATGALGTARALHSASLLASGKVLVAGGVGALKSAELYDPALGTWAPTGALAASRQSHASATLANGKVLVTSLLTAELYHPDTGTWTLTGPPLYSRIAHAAVPLPNGTVLVAGGTAATKAAELFDPATGEFKVTGEMFALGRTRFTASLLPGGKVLVAGGSVSNTPVATTELYDATSGAWSQGPSLAAARGYHAAATLASGKVMLVGGTGSTNKPLATADVFDPVAVAWTPMASMATARHQPTVTPLPSGAFLVAGGRMDSGTALATAELLSGAPNGTACTIGDDCATGLCADGVCCDRACGACEACSAAKKGAGADGVCEPVSAGSDPDGDCAEEAVSTCGTTGSCDGKGACAKYPAGTVCVPEVCAESTVTTSVCDGAGVCAPTAKNCAPYGCTTTGCRTSCQEEADCAPGSACSASHECVSGTTCDGAHTLTDPSGTKIDCTPYVCDGSGCKQGCASVKDCVDGFVCTVDGACLAAEPETSAPACDASGAPASGRAELVLGGLGVAMALAGRRRRMER